MPAPGDHVAIERLRAAGDEMRREAARMREVASALDARARLVTSQGPYIVRLREELRAQVLRGTRAAEELDEMGVTFRRKALELESGLLVAPAEPPVIAVPVAPTVPATPTSPTTPPTPPTPLTPPPASPAPPAGQPSDAAPPVAPGGADEQGPPR